MAALDANDDGNEPVWRQRAVARSLNAARSRAEQRVQRYLDAAFELIDEKGTTEFTIQEVVERSKQSLRGVETAKRLFGGSVVAMPKNAPKSSHEAANEALKKFFNTRKP